MTIDLSIVVPVYNSEKSLPNLVDRLSSVLKPGFSIEIILVDDGSRDRSTEVAKEIAERNSEVKVISFMKNFGQINALMAGLRESRGRICVTIDDDLQNPPEEIPNMIKEIENGNDFVFGVPKMMMQNVQRRTASNLTIKLSEYLLGKPKELQTSSFIALHTSLVREMVRYDGPYPYLAGLIFRSSTKGKHILVDHKSREFGVSQYSLKKLVSLWLNGVTNFSVLPLRLAALFGFITAVFGFIITFFLILQAILFGRMLPGWLSTISCFALLSGVQLVALGLLGEYIGRAFMLLNRSPQYVIREKINC